MTVAKQNNQAVALLRGRDFHNALDTLSRALVTHRALQDTSDLQAGCQRIDECMLLSGIEDEAMDISAQATFVYKHGIMLLYPPSLAEPATVTTVLIFNSALVHHLAAETSSYKTSRCLLLKARRLYELAYKSADRSMDDNLLFQFSVLNNIMVIDRSLGISGIAVSRDFFEHLLSILMVLVDRGCTRKLRHIKGFLVHIPSPVETAAAA